MAMRPSLTASAVLVALMVFPITAANDDISCPLSVNDCACQKLDGGYNIWCPNSYESHFHLQYRTGELLLYGQPHPERELTEWDLLAMLKRVNLTGVDLDKLLLDYCPFVQNNTYAILLKATGIKSLKELQVILTQ